MWGNNERKGCQMGVSAEHCTYYCCDIWIMNKDIGVSIGSLHFLSKKTKWRPLNNCLKLLSLLYKTRACDQEEEILKKSDENSTFYPPRDTCKDVLRLFTINCRSVKKDVFNFGLKRRKWYKYNGHHEDFSWYRYRPNSVEWTEPWRLQSLSQTHTRS